METPRYEAAVIGGGPAGAAAALALARGGRRVLLLDASAPAAFRVGEALPPAGRPLLRDLGVLDAFLADGHLPCYANLSAWGGGGLHETDFIYDRNGHGWHLDRARFDARLRAAASDAGAGLREGTRLRAAERAGGGWRLHLTSEEGNAELRCGWIADATGRGSAVARRHGATRMHDDALVAFAARFRSPSPEAGSSPEGGSGDRDGRTLVEAAPDGWWYAALVPSGERVVAFLTDADLAGRELLTAEGFRARLEETEHVRAIIDRHGYEMEGRPRGADASSARLDRFTGDGWVAAGDAALGFDPLSSQGILTALYTGMKAGQSLHAHLSGDADALGGYVDRLEEIHRAYAANRLTHYALETRWPDHPFWHRRHAARGSTEV
jgi:flavin-dependent dehydrogenase